MPRFQTVQPVGGLPASVPVPRIPEGAFGAGTAQALGRFGGVLTTLGAEREAEATRLRQEREVTEGATAIGVELDAVRDQVRRTTDVDQVGGLVDEGLRRVTDRLRDVQDPAVREALRRQIASRRLLLTGEAADRRFTLEIDRSRAATDAALAQRQQTAISDPNPVARGAALAEVDTLISTAVGQGTLRAEEGVAKRAAVRRAVTAGRVEAQVLEDPTAAIAVLENRAHPLTAELPEDDRQQALERARNLERTRLTTLLDLEDRSRRLEREEREERERVLEDDLTSRALEGALGLEEVEGLRQTRALTDERYRRVRGLLEGQRQAGGVDTPDLALSVRREILLGEIRTPAGVTRFLGRGLSGKTVNDLVTLVRSVTREGTPEAQRVNDADVVFHRARLQDAIKTRGPLEAIDRDAQQREVLALQEFWDRVVVGGERPDRVTGELIDRFAQFPKLTAEQLPTPRFKTFAEIEQAFTAQLLTRRDYVRAVTDLQRWLDAQAAAAAARPEAGRLDRERTRRGLR